MPSKKSPARCWLMKSEPSVYSIDDLKHDGATEWEGVRNYQARNFMRDDMQVGDLVLFYHSNAKPAGVAGLARICKAGYPDDTALDPKSHYYDPRATQENLRWVRVDLTFVERFDALLPLQTLKEDPALEGMLVIRRGQRLSVQPVDRPHLEHILKLGHARTRR